MVLRTSHTHPLRIDTVQPEGVPGQIGLTLCPGKVQRGALSGEWSRDLAADLETIRRWGATTILNLLEDHELQALQVADIGRMVASYGLHYERFPIPDGGVPPTDSEAEWQAISRRLRRRLEEGERILVHCKGGLGRTGMMAARLLVELGADPETAIRQVRRARPGAIETREQAAYVRRQRPLARIIPPPIPLWRSREEEADTVRDRFLGCLLGGAVGDALGAPVEFMKRAQILAQFGPHGIADYVPAYGRLGAITDDTQMTLFTAEGLIRGWVRSCMRGITTHPGVTDHAYLRWLRTQGETPACELFEGMEGWLFKQQALHNRRAPGNTCLDALRQKNHLGDFARNNSKGCGGVMRIAPVGLFAWHWHPGISVEETFRLGCELARLTHGHPTGYLAAGVLAVVILGLLDAASLRDSLMTAKACLTRHAHHEETLQAIEQAEQLASEDVGPADAIRQLGEGWVAEEALAISLYCALVADSFETGVLLAINHDGDTDSTGAVTGNLLGASGGTAQIPRRWLEPLELREVITEIAADLFEMKQWRIGEYAGARDNDWVLAKYPPC